MRAIRSGHHVYLAGALCVLPVACGSADDREEEWELVSRRLPSALLSVWGTSERDVFAVGSDADDGLGPAVLHYDGDAWTRLETGQEGDLWWVFGFEGGPVYMGGEGGMILRYQAGSFARMATPGTGTVFGIWGPSADDVWAVGGSLGGASGAFAWRLAGDAWELAPGFPSRLAARDAIWKMYGRSADDAWMVGTNGKTVRWDGASMIEATSGAEEPLFTVHADVGRFAAVGGFGAGKIVENGGGGWVDVSPTGAPGLIGVWLSPEGDYAVGQQGAIYERGESGWSAVDVGLYFDESFHSVWVDPSGGVWAVGGHVLAFPLKDGVILHRGRPVAELE